MRPVNAILLIAGLIVLSCQHSEDRYLQRGVSAGEIVGTWQMTSAAVSDLRSDIVGYTAPIDPSEHRIIIRTGGTCVFETLPTTVVRAGKLATKIEADCRWTLSNGERQTLRIIIPSDSSAGVSQRPRNVHYYFDETEDGRLLLWQHLDDPDQWKYIEYMKL